MTEWTYSANNARLECDDATSYAGLEGKKTCATTKHELFKCKHGECTGGEGGMLIVNSQYRDDGSFSMMNMMYTRTHLVAQIIQLLSHSSVRARVLIRMLTSESKGVMTAREAEEEG